MYLQVKAGIYDSITLQLLLLAKRIHILKYHWRVNIEIELTFKNLNCKYVFIEHLLKDLGQVI